MTDALLKVPSNYSSEDGSIFEDQDYYYDDYDYDSVEFVVYRNGEDYFVTHSEASRAT